MDSSHLIYDEEHMASLSAKYLEAAEAAEKATGHVNTIAREYASFYKGDGNALFDGAATGIYEHLTMLETCARSLGKYVEQASANMKKAEDESNNYT